uniref:DUF3991 domain-containing protein n=1 Tax=Roseburia sp. TaxID=2049040 RepID=UPI003FEECF68
MGHFSEEQMNQAKEASLTQLAAAYGYTPKRIGKLYTLKEHDSVRIYNDRTWCRWSRKNVRNESGGSQIDFLMQFCGVQSVPEAVRILLEFQGISVDDIHWNDKPRQHQAIQKSQEESERAEFVLPKVVEGTYKRAYAYLIKTRGLSQKVVDYFVRDQKLLYEEKEYHNLVFVGKDKDGIARYATKRSTSDIYGSKYRGDVAGNDKNYGVNIVNLKSDELKVFEASIDLMSYLDVTGDYESNKLVLGMTADNPLVQFLKDYSHIKRIGFCLDNDKGGMLAMYGNGDYIGLLRKYAELGYTTYADYVPENIGCKDWNEYLIYKKQNENGLQDVETAPRQTRHCR